MGIWQYVYVMKILEMIFHSLLYGYVCVCVSVCIYIYMYVCTYVCVYVCENIFTILSAWAECNTRSISFYTEFNRFEFRVFLSPRLVAKPKLKSPLSLTILPIGQRRILGFIHFLEVLALCEMQTALSRIWTCITKSISYCYIHYTTIDYI